MLTNFLECFCWIFNDILPKSRQGDRIITKGEGGIWEGGGAPRNLPDGFYGPYFSPIISHLLATNDNF